MSRLVRYTAAPAWRLRAARIIRRLWPGLLPLPHGRCGRVGRPCPVRVTLPRTATLVVLALLLLAACKSRTEYGKCIGLNGHADSTLTYEYSARNIFWGAVGFEFIYPPIKVALDELWCPVGKKP